MSRFTNFKNGLEIVYGYDRPLNEYFLQVFENEVGKNNKDTKTLFSISNKFTMVPHPDFPNKREYSTEELVEIMKEYEIPSKHLKLISENKEI